MLFRCTLISGGGRVKHIYALLSENRRMVLLFLAYTGLFYLCTQYFLFFLPFLLGCLFALLLTPLCRAFCRKTKQHYKTVIFCVTASSFVLLFAVFLLVSVLLVREAVQLFSEKEGFRFEELHPKVQIFLHHLFEKLPSFGNDITEHLPKLLPYTGTFVKALLSLPAVLIFPALTYVFTSVLLLNRRKIRRFFAFLIGPKDFLRLKHGLQAQTKASSGLVFSYTLIYLTTFAESSVILRLLNMPYPFITALIVTVSDVFPVLGPGAALFPLCIYRLLCGSWTQAIGLFVGWLLITVLRQIIEPRLISKITRTPGTVMLAAVYTALLFHNFWIIPYTALLFYLYGLFADSKLIPKPTYRRKKTRLN